MTCLQCGSDKPRTKFQQSRARKDGSVSYSRFCTSCRDFGIEPELKAAARRLTNHENYMRRKESHTW